MSLAIASPSAPVVFVLPRWTVPGAMRARVLRRAAFVAGSAGFAVAVWTLMSAVILLG